jgi:hypothetical protein
MNSPTSEEVTEKSPSAKPAVDAEVRDFEQGSTKPAHTAHSKVGIDAERIRSSIARPTSNSTDELEKLIVASAQRSLAIPLEPVPGIDVLYDIGVPILLIWYWFTFFRDATSRKSNPSQRDQKLVISR